MNISFLLVARPLAWEGDGDYDVGMEQANLILNRRVEVEQEIARLKARISDMQAELAELETAERVISRLSEAKHPGTGPRDRPSQTRVYSRNGKNLSLPEMIEAVLAQEANWSSDFQGWEPKEIGRRIDKDYPDASVRGEAVSSICWRMWKRGQLEKVEGTSNYRLPIKEKPADLLSPAGEQSAGLSINPVRKAVKPVREVAHDNSLTR